MTNHQRRAGVRTGLILGLLVTAAMSAAIGAGCGDATIKTFQPCVTPALDTTFRNGVLQVFQSRDCYNGAACHNVQNQGGPASGLGLGGVSPDEVYQNLMTGGAQGQGPDYDVVTGTNAAKSLILQKPLATNPIAHSGGKVFGSESDPGYKAILVWASSGAPNNGTDGC